MSAFLKKIRLFTGDFILNRMLKKANRSRQVISLEEAQTIAIIYDVVDEKRFDIIKKTAKETGINNRQVMVVGYIDSKTIPDYCVAANAGYYFNREGLNWFGGPKSDYLEQFMQKTFDVLIDLSTENHFVTRYIAGVSQSRFKAGNFNPAGQKIYDLMIEEDPEKSFEQYVNHTMHYLKIIKSK